MKTIEELLTNLARPEVLEFGLVTNRLPSVNIGGKFEPVDDEAPSTERLMAMLVTMGGGRYVDSLSDKPVQWTTRLDGVGVIAVAAILRKDIVQARFTVAKRDAGAASARSPVAAAPPSAGNQAVGRPAEKAAPANQPASATVAATRSSGQQGVVRAPESRPIPGAAPSPQPTSTKSSSGAHPPASSPSTQTRAQPALGAPPSSSMSAAKATAQIQPQVIRNVVGGAPVQAGRVQPSPQAPPVQPAQAVPPPEDEWDDDDEPTLQTLSPPVSRPPGTGPGGPRPKPARRPEEVSRPDVDEAPGQDKAAAEKAAAEKAAAEKAAAEKAAAEKAAAEKAAAEKAAAEKAAAEKAAAEKATAEKAAAEKAAAEKAAAEKAAQERAVAEKAAQERAAAEKAAQERAAAEKAAQERAAAEKAAQERAAAEKAAQERAAAEKAAAEKAAQERAAAEKAAAERAAQEKAAAERAAQERAARERAAQEQRAAQAERAKSVPAPAMGSRRINTPTSVDVVDVEITTSDSAAAKRPGVRLDIDLDADGADNTVSLPGADGAPAYAAEKDRPRVDASAAVDSFLAMAVAARASDLVIVAGRPILLRVATDLLPRTQSLTAEHVERIAKEIVPVRLRETLEREGSCEFAVEHPSHGRFRVNVSKQRTGFKLNLRVIPRELPTLAALGLPEALANALRHQRGLVLVTGPASQGKSTTLAVLVEQLNRETARHIMTIEDPIEHVHPRKKSVVSQRDVGLHGRTRVRTVQTALREDVDTLVIADMRDADSVRDALVACEGGRLVLATMNMPSAAKTVDRILDLFSPAEEPWVRLSLASSLRLIVGQRLVPSADRTRLHAAVELLPWSVALYTLIRDGRTHQIPDLQKRGKAVGVVRLDESLADLVRAQKVTAEVAKQFAESPADFDGHVARPGAGLVVQTRKG